MVASLVGVSAAVVVGAVLVVAGVAKLASPTRWQAEAASMGVPRLLSAPVPVVEIVLGAVLTSQLVRPLAGWLAVGLLGAFTLLVVGQLARGRRPVCMCFGALSSRPIGPLTVVRNGALIAVAVVAAIA